MANLQTVNLGLPAAVGNGTVIDISRCENFVISIDNVGVFSVILNVSPVLNDTIGSGHFFQTGALTGNGAFFNLASAIGGNAYIINAKMMTLYVRVAAFTSGVPNGYIVMEQYP